MVYFALLAVCFFIGLSLQLIYKIRLYHSFKEEIIFVITILVIMIPMDIYAVAKGLWSFSGKGIIGIHIFNLPIEEYLFAIIVPYFMLMVYKALDKKIK